ncbi:MAG: phosphatidate cytidylyltransferase [Halothiobacillaceae bacterium]|nr:phosphatidate cytidylyltransferase [Halothiobacillaceae bacterium]HER34009.1 phosphatidate cytidylyltransferase [Halothiobacillaceae bacterium]
MTGTPLRLATGALAGLVSLAVVLLAPERVFLGITLILMGWAAVEWFRLCGLEPCQIAPWVGATVALAIGLHMLWPDALRAWLLAAVAMLWFGLFTAQLRHRRERPANRPFWLRRLVGLVALPAFWLALVWVHAAPRGEWLLVFGVLVVVIADSFAYFVGRAVGRRKLAPMISPGKSVEGALGGLAGVAVLSAIGAVLPLFAVTPSWQLAMWCTLMALASVGGDLEESRLKREAGVKDSGRLLPGHGGVLDRLDGQFAAMPLWWLGLWQMQLLGGA